MVFKPLRMAWLNILMLSLIFAGCGPAPSPPPAAQLPPVPVSLSSPTPLLALPVYVADRLGLFRDQGIEVHFVRSAAIRIQLAGSEWPVVGTLAERPDAFLVAPAPDPHFRLRALRDLPIYYAREIAREWPTVQTVLAHHQVTHPQGEMLSMSQIRQLWKNRHLPWAVVSLSDFYRLRTVNRETTVLAWFGASTGDFLHLVVTAAPQTPHLTTVLSALDIALWYLHTTAPSKIADLFADAPPTPRAGISRATIQSALTYGFWPVTVLPTRPAYQRAAHFSEKAHRPWPSYLTGVQLDPAQAALANS